METLWEKYWVKFELKRMNPIYIENFKKDVKKNL